MPVVIPSHALSAAAPPVVDAARALGWPGPGHDWRLRRYDLSRFLWSARVPPAAVAGLDALLRGVGGRAAAYADDVLASPVTARMQRLWETNEGAAQRTLRTAMAGTGLEPPDTGLLRWGATFGPLEAAARDAVIDALEAAVEAGRLTSRGRGARVELTEAVLRRGSLLADVRRERMAAWIAGREATSPAPLRAALLGPLAPALIAEPPAADAVSGLGPVLWLLGLDGIELTRTGALPREVVREAVARWPAWSPGGGEPSREDEVPALGHLDRFLRNMRLVRPQGARLVRTRRGTELLDEPDALLAAAGVSLLEGDDFRAAVTELAAALLVSADSPVRLPDIPTALVPALHADGWHAAGADEPPDARDVGWLVNDLVHTATGLGFLTADLVLTDVGRTGLLAGLRARALAPQR